MTLVLSILISTMIKLRECHHLPYSISSAALSKQSLQRQQESVTLGLGTYGQDVCATRLVWPISMWLEDWDDTVCGMGWQEHCGGALPPCLSYCMN